MTRHPDYQDIIQSSGYVWYLYHILGCFEKFDYGLPETMPKEGQQRARTGSERPTRFCHFPIVLQKNDVLDDLISPKIKVV
jgi:hypothetical protein